MLPRSVFALKTYHIPPRRSAIASIAVSLAMREGLKVHLRFAVLSILSSHVDTIKRTAIKPRNVPRAARVFTGVGVPTPATTIFLGSVVTLQCEPANWVHFRGDWLRIGGQTT